MFWRLISSNDTSNISIVDCPHGPEWQKRSQTPSWDSQMIWQSFLRKSFTTKTFPTLTFWNFESKRIVNYVRNKFLKYNINISLLLTPQLFWKFLTDQSDKREVRLLPEIHKWSDKVFLKRASLRKHFPRSHSESKG